MENANFFSNVILGPGALGCGFAAFLQSLQNPSNEFFGCFLGGGADPRHYSWAEGPYAPLSPILEEKAGLRSDVRSSVCHVHNSFFRHWGWFSDPTLGLNTIDPKALVFSFLPAGQEESLVSFCEAAAATGKELDVIICSNGIFSGNYLKQIPLQHRVSRMIFYSGFDRDKTKLQITYKGGQKVLWGAYEERPVTDRELGGFERLRALLGTRSATLKQGQIVWPPLEVLSTLEIESEEFSKFYVNWMLAFGAGPKAQNNLEAWKALSAEQKKLWTLFFEGAAAVQPWGAHLKTGVFSQNLLRRLEETALSTATNVNSVSRAFQAGQPWPFLQLCSTLLDLKEQLGFYSEASKLVSWIDRELTLIQNNWGVTKFKWK